MAIAELSLACSMFRFISELRR